MTPCHGAQVENSGTEANVVTSACRWAFFKIRGDTLVERHCCRLLGNTEAPDPESPS